MYAIEEEQYFCIKQVINKMTVIRKLAENGGERSINLTSEQFASIFIDLEDNLQEIVQNINMDQSD